MYGLSFGCSVTNIIHIQTVHVSYMCTLVIDTAYLGPTVGQRVSVSEKEGNQKKPL